MKYVLILLVWASACLAVPNAFGGQESQLLRVALSAPIAEEDADEHPEELEARRRAIVQAIEEATPDFFMRAALLQTAKDETKLARYADLDHDSCRLGPRCDKGKAWSIWQLHGTDRKGTRTDAAKRAAALLRFGMKRCGSLEGGIAIYATGNSCKWSGAKARADRIRATARRIGAI